MPTVRRIQTAVCDAFVRFTFYISRMNQVAATFIVRVASRNSGDWTAVVERVKTGEKFRVGELEEIGVLIAKIVSEEGGGKVPPG